MLWGEYSGVGTFEHAFLHHGVPAEKLSEDNILKQRVLRHRFPTADLSDRAGSSGSTIRAPSVLVAAGLPCQPFAPGGSKLAEHDERADGVTNDVPDAVASLEERYISVDVEEHEAFLSTGSVALERFDARLAANRPPLVRSPSRPCLFDSIACNGKIRRPRCALRWELTSVVARIGEAPPLRPILALRSRIRDIALPDDDIRPEQYVDGVLTLVDHCVSRDRPTVAATLAFGGPDVPIREGSRARHPSYNFELVVVSYPDDPSLPLLLMRDKRGHVAYFPNHTRDEQLTNVATTFGVFSMEGIAASFTKMGVSPLGSAKQLWLRNGRAYAPDYRELVRLLECHPDFSSHSMSTPAYAPKMSTPSSVSCYRCNSPKPKRTGPSRARASSAPPLLSTFLGVVESTPSSCASLRSCGIWLASRRLRRPRHPNWRRRPARPSLKRPTPAARHSRS